MFEKTIYVQGDYEVLLWKVEQLEAKLKENGLRVPESSRFGNYRRILGRVLRSGNTVAEPDLRLAHQALFECNQLLLIVEELAREPEVQGWRAKVKVLISGQDLPDAEDAHTPGRNTQFELYVAGICRRAGYKVTLCEPDVVIETSEGPLGFAAKRVKSLKQLIAALKCASNQLKRADLEGFPALDLSVPLGSKNAPWVAENLEKAKEMSSVALSDFIHSNKFRIRDSVDQNHAFGLIVFLTSLFVFTDQDILSLVTVCRALNLCSEHDVRRNQAIASFVERIAMIELE